MKHVDLSARYILAWVKQNQLVSGIALVIVITLLLTTISMTLYVSSGASGLDLSRPGFDAERNRIDKGDQTKTEFSATGLLTEKDIDEFMRHYAEHRNALKAIGSFSDDTLSDESLGLTMPTEQPPQQ